MAIMSEKDTYTNNINDTDERGGDADSLEHGNAESPQRRGADSLEHGDAELSDHNSAVSSAHGGAEPLDHNSAASPEHDGGEPSQRGGTDSLEYNNAEPSQRGGTTSLEHGGPELPGHDSASSLESDSASHEAKPTPVERHASHAAETASAYFQKARDFLGLHKKATTIAAAIALCVVVGIGAAVASNSKPSPNGALFGSGFASYAANAIATTTDAAADEAAAGLVAQRLTPDALNSVDSFASAPDTFSLIEGKDAALLSEEQQESLAAATQNIEGGGYTVGFTLINLNTGKGIAYNLDSRVYGASSFKGPYAAYLCQHLGDSDASYPSGSEAAGSGVSSSIYSLMQPMILYSDNNAFSSLRNSYDSAGFAEWLNSCGVDSEIMHDTHFPRYSARESALLWLHTYQYLKTNTPTAQNLASLYEQTNVSFIRSGVSDDEGVEAVLNKAGWCAGRERFTGLCDAGLIKCTDGTTYLMSTMTNSPDGGLYTVRLANLASALFECRDALE